MPDRLLPLLTDVPQSGEELGARLGVGRVTVSALARKLLDSGVPVEVSRAGYALTAGSPAPALVRPLLRGEVGRVMRYAGTVGSTQDEVRAWADDPRSPAPHGAVFVAERQSGGRGRRGRTWETGSGNLAFSVLLRGEPGLGLSLRELSFMPLAVGVALREALGVGGLKWPNDLLSPDGRKMAGILLDADLRGEEVRRAVLGIGVNVGFAPAGAAALHEFQPDWSRAAVLARILNALSEWLGAAPERVLTAWREQNCTLGRRVKVPSLMGPSVTGEGVVTAVDIDPQGNLIVQDAQGRTYTVHAGDVQLVGEW